MTVLELETVIALSAMDEGWLEINVTEAIEHWRLGSNWGVSCLYMEVTDKQGENQLENSIWGEWQNDPKWALIGVYFEWCFYFVM